MKISTFIKKHFFGIKPKHGYRVHWSARKKLRNWRRWMLLLWPICHWCGERLTKETAQLDHLLPVLLGGKHRADNVVLSCHSCNLKRGNSFL